MKTRTHMLQVEALTDALEEANAGATADKEMRRMLDEARPEQCF